VPYRFLDDAPTADVGFVAAGDTLDECFQSAADATLEVMLANPHAMQAHERRTVHVEHDTLDLALLRFLEELIFYKDAEGLLLRTTTVKVTHRRNRWTVDATVEGEAIDPTRHHLSADVKAVTMHRLSVQRINGAWQATVVLDV
jgi:SHS2 domain-containing protein